MTKEPVIWLISNEHWPRACPCAELNEGGYEARGFVSVMDAVEGLASKTARKPRAIVVELRDQDISREQLQHLQTAGSPFVALCGSLELNDPLAREIDWAVLLKRRITLGTVAAIEKLIPLQIST
jgi:hypothetical protein